MSDSNTTPLDDPKASISPAAHSEGGATRTGHTPGPWAVNPVSAQVDAAGMKRGKRVTIPVCKLLWPTTLRDEAETFANAQLIAAAPMLLTELKAAVDLVELLVRKARTKNPDDADAIAYWHDLIAEAGGTDDV